MNTRDALFFFELKVGSVSRPSDVSEDKYRRYMDAGNGWSNQVFRSRVGREVFGEMYQLFRHWLLGTWMVEKLWGVQFYLISLSPDNGMVDFIDRFGMYVNGGGKHLFTRTTWERLYYFLKENNAGHDIEVF